MQITVRANVRPHACQLPGANRSHTPPANTPEQACSPASRSKGPSVEGRAIVMTTVLHLAAVIGAVFAINLLRAFGPPTWAVLVFISFQWPDIPTAALIGGGALAATAGRLVLALGTRKLRRLLSAERRANLQALGQTLAGSKTGALASIAIFVFSPLPSAQLFMAAGLADVPLLPLAGAFLIAAPSATPSTSQPPQQPRKQSAVSCGRGSHLHRRSPSNSPASPPSS